MFWNEGSLGSEEPVGLLEGGATLQLFTLVVGKDFATLTIEKQEVGQVECHIAPMGGQCQLCQLILTNDEPRVSEGSYECNDHIYPKQHKGYQF